MTDIVERLRMGGPNAWEMTDEAADEIERLWAALERCQTPGQDKPRTKMDIFELCGSLERENARLTDEIERLRALVLDACEAFDLYDLPHQAFHYRREVLGLDAAKKIARTHLTT